MLAKIKQTKKELGSKDTAFHALERLLNIISFKHIALHKYYITQQPVRSAKTVPANKGLDIHVQEIDAQHPSLLTMERPASVLETRFAHNGHCFAAFKDGVFSGNLWLNFDRYQEDEVRCTYILKPVGEAAWDYDVYVQPKYRFSYVFAKLWDHANEVMTNMGVKNVYSRINYYNISSLQAHKRLGSRIIGSVYFINIGAWQLSVSSSFRPRVTFSTKRNVFPEIVIGK